jgi:hypothetical protein
MPLKFCKKANTKSDADRSNYCKVLLDCEQAARKAVFASLEKRKRYLQQAEHEAKKENEQIRKTYHTRLDNLQIKNDLDLGKFKAFLETNVQYKKKSDVSKFHRNFHVTVRFILFHLFSVEIEPNSNSFFFEKIVCKNRLEP